MFHLLRQSQCPHEVGEIVGQGVKLEPDGIVAEPAALSMAGENCTVLAIENFSLGACGRTPSRGVGGVALDGAVDKRVVSIATENFSFL